jgi:hypothetical protein
MYNLQVKKLEKHIFLTEYQFKDISFVEYFKNLIDQKVGIYDGKTNVKGKMTSFKCFVGDKELHKLLIESTEFLKISHFQPTYLDEAWGNILGKGDKVLYHTHWSMVYSGILYLTEGGPGTHFPQFDYTVKEKIGKMVFFSGEAYHGVKETNKNQKRYTLAFNFAEKVPWA